MGILLNILIFIAAIIGTLLIIALLIKKEYVVAREITINKPLSDVFNYVKILKNNLQYNEWWKIDPNQKMDYTGVDGTVGFIAAWDSENKNAGKGAQEITKIVENVLVDTEVRFEKPFKNVGQIAMYTSAATPNSTNLKWQFSGANPFPMSIMNLLVPKLLGGALDKSLNSLKNILEQ